MFSERTAWSRERSELARAMERLVDSGATVLDLTGSNPTQVGFVYDTELFHATRYTPDPLGLPEARRAIADYYRGHGAEVPPDRIWIGAGTSELYAQLMWMLCDPGDTILVPRPGYPLFDYIADLCGVRLAHYPLSHDGTWCVNTAEVREVLAKPTPPLGHPSKEGRFQDIPSSGGVREAGGGWNSSHYPRARAVIAVSPHNPTGHVLSPDELKTLESLCAERGLALIVDEVFLDYPLAESMIPTSAGDRSCLTFTLSGLSKVAAWPQCKVSWGVVSGPEDLAREALSRLELVSDTFLNASTVMQGALLDLLRGASNVQERIRSRCRENLKLLCEILRDSPATVLDVKAGWTVLIRLPAIMDDVSWAMRLLEQAHILLQPGYLFDMQFATDQPHIALSLITLPDVFREGVRGLVRALDRA